MSHEESPNAGSERAAVGTSRRGAAPTSWDPFERVYDAAGAIDREYASKRLPVLVDLLRRHPACFASRIDVERLGTLLLAPDAQDMRDAADQEAFEAGLRRFSENHLHEIVDEGFLQRLGEALMGIASDEAMSRRDRAAAALGVALLSTAPDRSGLRGRGLVDIVLRVTMEEQTAQENLRRQARETEGGLAAADLAKFWDTYPALRWQHEERYRREVAHVLKAIEQDRMPPALTVDLGMRGASALLAEVAKARAAGGEIDARAAERILRVPFVQDMADEGAQCVVARWRAEMADPDAANSEERRAVVRSLEMGTRLVEEQGPGSDAVLFYVYLRAVVQGHYHVRDEAELDVAKTVFGTGGLVPSGAIGYAAHLAQRGDAASQRRVLLAAFELWPGDTAVRAAVEAMGLAEEAAAKASRLGPTYQDATEKAGGDIAGDAEGGA